MTPRWLRDRDPRPKSYQRPGSTFIQWKGTEVCVDIHCPCGASVHYDGWNAYCYKCPHCLGVFELGQSVIVKPISEHGLKWWTPVNPEPDEDLPFPRGGVQRTGLTKDEMRTFIEDHKGTVAWRNDVVTCFGCAHESHPRGEGSS